MLRWLRNVLLGLYPIKEGEDYPGIKVGAFILNSGEKILLMKRGPGAFNEPGLFDLPGGGKENCEHPDDTVLRKCLEEIRLPVEITTRLRPYMYILPDQEWLVIAYICRIINSSRGEPQPVVPENKQGEIELVGYYTFEEFQHLVDHDQMTASARQAWELFKIVNPIQNCRKM